MTSAAFVELTLYDEAQLKGLIEVVGALQLEKHAETLSPGPRWRACFPPRALAAFWWPTPVQLEARRRRAAPAQVQSITDPAEWDFDSLIDAFANGEYELLGVCRVERGVFGRRHRLARLEFTPLAFPYGGTECMGALIRAFGGTLRRVAP